MHLEFSALHALAEASHPSFLQFCRHASALELEAATNVGM
jgi:hypothetical protein